MTLPQGFAAAPGSQPRLLHLVDRTGLDAWRLRQPPSVQQWLAAHAFDASAGSLLVLPGGDGVGGAVLGIGDRLDPASYAFAPMALPPGDWRVDGDLDADVRVALQLGWGLGAYRYTRFRAAPRAPAQLVLDTLDDETADVLLNEPAPAKIRLWVGPERQGSMSSGAVPPFPQLALSAGSKGRSATTSWSTR